MDNLTKRLTAYNDSNIPTMEKIKGLIEILESYWNLKQPLSTSESIIKEFVNFATRDTLVTVISRGLLNAAIEKIQMFKTSELCLPLLNMIIDKIQSRLLSFEEQLFQIRIMICHHHEKDGNFLEAAKILSLSNLETSQKSYSNEHKLRLYLQVAQLYSKADEYKLAESFVNRASIIQVDSVNPRLLIELKICQAQGFEHKGKFAEAAQRFTCLCAPNKHISETLSLGFLKQALACTLLSPCDEHRSMLIAHFKNDERCAQLNIFNILRGMYNDGFISKQEIETLQEFLSEKQRNQKQIKDMSVLQYVTTEHNIIVYSKVYKNVFISFLSKSLGVSVKLLQQIISTMIYEKRLNAVMDQVKMAVIFETNHPGKDLDATVDNIASDIDSLFTDINKKYGSSLMSMTPQLPGNNFNEKLLAYNLENVNGDEDQGQLSSVELKILDMMPLFESKSTTKTTCKQSGLAGEPRDHKMSIDNSDKTPVIADVSKSCAKSPETTFAAGDLSKSKKCQDHKVASIDDCEQDCLDSKCSNDSNSPEDKMTAKVRATRIKSATGVQDGTTMKIRIDRGCTSESRDLISRSEKLPRSQQSDRKISKESDPNSLARQQQDEPRKFERNGAKRIEEIGTSKAETSAEFGDPSKESRQCSDTSSKPHCRSNVNSNIPSPSTK